MRKSASNFPSFLRKQESGEGTKKRDSSFRWNDGLEMALSNNSIRKKVLETIAFIFAFGMVIFVSAFISYSVMRSTHEVAVEPLLTASTALFAIMGGLITFYLNKKNSLEEEHRKHKISTYQNFLLFELSRALSREKDLPDPKDSNPGVFLNAVVSMISWSSLKVLEKINNYNYSVEIEKNEEAYSTKKMGDLLDEIRMDIGHKSGSGKELIDYLLIKDSELWKQLDKEGYFRRK